jgi:hypothetical protein
MVHVPATTLGHVVPAETELKSRFGAPRVKTEKRARVLPRGRVMVKTWVAPGALKIFSGGLHNTFPVNRGAIGNRQATVRTIDTRIKSAG